MKNQTSEATPKMRPADSQCLANSPGERPAANDIERRLVEIWERSFDRRPIGVEQSFSELGGDSLLAVEIFIQIEEEFGKRMAYDMLLEAPTIRSISELLSKPTEISSSMLVTLRAEGSRPPLFCLPGLGGCLMGFQDLADCLGAGQPVYGLRPQGSDGAGPPHTNMRDWAAESIAEMRSVQPEGPYFLVGFCLGGVLGFEMAQQLTAAGQRVGLIAMVDSQLWSPEDDLSLSDRLRLHLWKLWHNDEGGRQKYLAVRWRLLRNRLRRGNLRHQPDDLVLNLDVAPHVRDMARAHFTAYQDYQPGIYHGSIALFTAGMRWKPDAKAIADPTLGWAQWVEGNLDVHEIPTTHTQMLTRPHAATLARAIETHLDRVAAVPILRRDPFPFEAVPLV